MCRIIKNIHYISETRKQKSKKVKIRSVPADVTYTFLVYLMSESERRPRYDVRTS